MCDRKILPVKSDIVFRLFFADERNEDYLVGFLKSVLRLPEDDYGEIEMARIIRLGEIHRRRDGGGIEDGGRKKPAGKESRSHAAETVSGRTGA